MASGWSGAARVRRVLLCSCIILVQSDAPAERQTVWAEIGGRAELPCPAEPTLPEDRAVLVLWYRESRTEPVYSYDARQGEFSNGVRWVDESVLGRRAFFKPLSEVPALSIDPVAVTDHGDFSCRVEYLKSPTTTVAFTLFVIIPPGPPTITWGSRPVVGAVGPLREGQPTELTCMSVGGRPPPSVSWWKEGVKIGAREEMGVSGGGIMEVTSKIRVFGGRDLAATPLKCQAHVHQRGHIVIPPRTASVTLNVTLPPLEVRISGGENPVTAGSSVRLVCLSSGSHPPASLSWWKGGSLLTSVTRTMADGGNVTTAAVILTVGSEDDGTVVTCRAENKALPGPALTDSLTLSVHYEPRVELMVRDDATRLKEGEATELECKVEANPPAHLYAWYLNGSPVPPQGSLWVVRAGRLSLPSVKPEQAGRYTCQATNLLGATTSNALHVTVLHPPRCAEGWKSRSESVARGETVTLTCRVDALPSDDLAYTWTTLLEDGRETLYPYQATNEGLTSVIRVTPHAVADYRTLVCRAANSIGRQQAGCHITLVPSGPPDPPHDCRGEAGGETGSLVVTCIEGFNGGLPQSFTLQAWQKGVLIANMTSEFPEWGIGGLAELEGVTVQISSSNSRGTSDVITLDLPNIASTQQLQHRHRLLKQQETLLGAPTWLPAVLGGIVGTLVLLLVVLLVSLTVMRRCKTKRTRRRQDSVKKMVSSDGALRREDELVDCAVTPTLGDGEARRNGEERMHLDMTCLSSQSRPSTGTSSPVREIGTRVQLNRFPPDGCVDSRTVQGQSPVNRAEALMSISDTCSETGSENTILCAPSHCSGASRSSTPLSPTAGLSPTGHRSPIHCHGGCSSPQQWRDDPSPHSPHLHLCQDRAVGIRLGSQEAEDSGLEDTVGSAENLVGKGCDRCCGGKIPSPETGSRQFMSSPNISQVSCDQGYENHPQRCLLLQQSMRRLPNACQRSCDGHHPHHQHHPHHHHPQHLKDVTGQKRYACIHKPSSSARGSERSNTLTRCDKGIYGGPKKPSRLPEFVEGARLPSHDTDNAEDETDCDRALLTNTNQGQCRIVPYSPHKESAV